MSTHTLTLELDGAPPSFIPLASGESVLDALLRAGIAVPNFCRAGACQSCLMRVTAGVVPAAAQVGLKDAFRARGLFLACSCVPTGDLAITFADGVTNCAPAIIREIERFSSDVCRVRLECEGPFPHFPGQFVNLARPDGLVRSYSIASLHWAPGLAPGDDHIELHVRKVAGGQMSGWLFDDARPGDAVELRGPAGDCFYVPGRPEQPILLVGTGTGLAPLYAIARDALRHGHTGPIRLYHGALRPAGLYLVDALRELAGRHGNFNYVPCVLNDDDGQGAFRTGAIDRVVFADLPKLAGWRAFLCGDPGLVVALRKKVYLAGAKMADIYADAFITAKGGVASGALS